MDIPTAKLNSSISSLLPTMASNSNQMSIGQHPLEAIAAGIQSATSSEHRGNRVSHMMSANEGPADIIGKVSGTVTGGKRVDDGPYFTNNEGLPFPDP
jgi:catalase